MPAVHEATATWEGDLVTGKGTVSTKSGVVRAAAASWKERTAGTGTEGLTSPEELLAAAHASCFSMALAAGLGKAGSPATKLEVTARVTFEPGAGKGVISSALTVRATAPGADAPSLRKLAEEAKDNCPISKALAGNVELSVEATLA